LYSYYQSSTILNLPFLHGRLGNVELSALGVVFIKLG
jgi:hypothetical protein